MQRQVTIRSQRHADEIVFPEFCNRCIDDMELVAVEIKVNGSFVWYAKDNDGNIHACHVTKDMAFLIGAIRTRYEKESKAV